MLAEVYHGNLSKNDEFMYNLYVLVTLRFTTQLYICICFPLFKCSAVKHCTSTLNKSTESI